MTAPNNPVETRPTILEYIEAAYLHGLCTENFDTGELEPPRDISEVKWISNEIEALIAKERLMGQIEELTGLMQHHMDRDSNPPFTKPDIHKIKDRIAALNKELEK